MTRRSCFEFGYIRKGTRNRIKTSHFFKSSVRILRLDTGPNSPFIIAETKRSPRRSTRVSSNCMAISSISAEILFSIIYNHRVRMGFRRSKGPVGWDSCIRIVASHEQTYLHPTQLISCVLRFQTNFNCCSSWSSLSIQSRNLAIPDLRKWSQSIRR